MIQDKDVSPLTDWNVILAGLSAEYSGRLPGKCRKKRSICDSCCMNGQGTCSSELTMRLFATDDAIGRQKITNRQLQHCQNTADTIQITISARSMPSTTSRDSDGVHLFKDGSVVLCGFHNSLRAVYRTPSSISGTQATHSAARQRFDWLTSILRKLRPGKFTWTKLNIAIRIHARRPTPQYRARSGEI